jgi:hypothetical protein
MGHRVNRLSRWPSKSNGGRGTQAAFFFFGFLGAAFGAFFAAVFLPAIEHLLQLSVAAMFDEIEDEEPIFDLVSWGLPGRQAKKRRAPGSPGEPLLI